MTKDPNMPYYSHTLEGHPPKEWEHLEVHLKEVSDMAAAFAKAFGAEEWARQSGLWHDLGKFHPGFQDYLMRENGYSAHLETVKGHVNHSTAGGLWAIQNLGPLY
ncbi:MAG: CRISPR-associated endonuclease Cas3'' [Kiritimatiellae bacterium]|jgi:CRISPR-associated endonuclease/helicase Cas3|nr:CRISPR-associated endonuclease Cas3'' [Kiritimatiellia bacterium]